MLRAGAEQVEHPALRVVALEQQIGGRGGFDNVPLLAITGEVSLLFTGCRLGTTCLFSVCLPIRPIYQSI